MVSPLGGRRQIYESDDERKKVGIDLKYCKKICYTSDEMLLGNIAKGGREH